MGGHLLSCCVSLTFCARRYCPSKVRFQIHITSFFDPTLMKTWMDQLDQVDIPAFLPGRETALRGPQLVRPGPRPQPAEMQAAPPSSLRARFLCVADPSVGRVWQGTVKQTKGGCNSAAVGPAASLSSNKNLISCSLKISVTH
jgi:hypothetical protein